MNFTCTQENLVVGLGQVAPIAGRNSQLPVLQHVLLEVKDHVLHLTTTDLEVGVHTIIGGKMKTSGSCIIPARRLFEYAQQLPNTHPIVIEKKGQVIVVTTKGFQAQFASADREEFPLLPTISPTQAVALDPVFFCHALTQTSFAASREDVRPEIRSVFLQTDGKELRVAATDSYRLAERVIPYSGERQWKFILPLPSAQEVVRLFSGEKDFHIIPHDNHVAFQSDTVELTSRLIDGQYPDYRQIIPASARTTCVVDREELIRALKTLTVFLPRDSRRIQVLVQPTKNTWRMRVQGGEVGEGEVELGAQTITGDEVEILLNVQYVMEGVQHMPGKDCQLLFGGAEDPVMIRPAARAADYVYLVMPIQV